VTVSKKYIHPTAKSLEGAFERLEDYNGRAAESLLRSEKCFRRLQFPLP
jgi:hypothetical protein